MTTAQSVINALDEQDRSDIHDCLRMIAGHRGSCPCRGLRLARDLRLVEHVDGSWNLTSLGCEIDLFLTKPPAPLSAGAETP